jgi:hypothetical protein
MHKAEVEALPASLPHEIAVDLSRLAAIGDRLTLADLPLSKGVSFVGEPESVVALIEEPRAAEEAAPEESAQIEAIEVAGGKKEKEKESEQEKESPSENEQKTSS